MDGYNLIDVGLVAVVMALTQMIKPHIRDRWVPVIPYVVSFALAALAVAYNRGPLPPLTFAAGVLLEGIKLAFAASGVYKLWHTTVRGS